MSSRVRGLVAAILDLLALGAVVGTAWVMAGPHGPLLPTGVVAQALSAAPGLLILRTLVETRPPFWARWIAGAAARPPGVGTAAAAGALAAALAGVAGWSFVHPRTDYPVPAALSLIAFAVALATAVPVGLLARLGTRLAPRAGRWPRLAFLGGCGAVGCLVWLVDPAADRVFSSEHALVAGLAVGGATFALVGGAALAAASAATAARRRLAAGGLALVAILGGVWLERPLAGEARPPDGWPRAVLLVTIDTLRADHLGWHGYPRDTSPRLDALAARSVVFDRAYAVMPTTDPSHAAILTGRLPRTTGITRNGQSLAVGDTASLASWLRARGYRTGAITARAHLDPDSLGLPGFQTFSAPVETSDARETYGRAARWVARHGDRPFFLWVHFWDPHSPYAPPAEHAARFVADEPAPYVHGIHPYVARPDRHAPRAVRYATALYDAEIRDADAWAGRLIEEVAAGLGANRVLTVVTADHGETLGELDAAYGYAFDHGKLLVRHELHVPLIVSWPGRLPEGRRVSRTVSNGGLLSTVSALLGEPVESDLDGFAHLLVDGPSGEQQDPPLLVERRSFAGPVRLPFLGAPETGVVADGWLYVENPERGTFLTPLAGDPPGPGQGAAGEAARREAMARTLRALTARYPLADAVLEEMDPEKIEALRSLGYIP